MKCLVCVVALLCLSSCGSGESVENDSSFFAKPVAIGIQGPIASLPEPVIFAGSQFPNESAASSE